MKCIDDEIPFEIPAGWEWVRLGNIIDFSKSETIKNQCIPQNAWVLDLEDIEKDSGRILHKKRMKDLQAKSDKHPFRKGNVLYSKLRPYLNKVIIADEDGVCTSEILCFDFGLISARFAQLYLMSPFFVSYAMSDAYGVKMPRLGSKQGNNALMPIPPLQEQHHIIAKVDELLPFVEHYSRSQFQLDQINTDIRTRLKKSILQEAIQGRLVPQIAEEGTAEDLLAKIRTEKQKMLKEGKLKKKDFTESVIFKGDDNKYYEKIGNETICIDEEIPFDIPHSWSWTRLGFLVSNETGLSYSKDCLSEKSSRMIRVLRGGNIEEGRWLTKDDDVMISASYVKDELILKRGTFITPAVTSIERMAKTALVEVDQSDIVVGGFVLMLKPFIKDDSLLRFLNLLFQSVYYKQYCIGITNKSGQAFYNLSRQKLMKCLIPIAPMKEMSRIAEKFASLNL